MVTVGIDPGSRRVGVARFYDQRLVKAEAFDVEGSSPSVLFDLIAAQCVGVDTVAIETPGEWLKGGKQNKSIVGIAKLYQAIGIIRAAAEKNAPEVRVLTDSEVKYAITGRKQAPKHDVHRNLWAVYQYQLPQLGKATCADCRHAGDLGLHSPDAADAISIGHVAVGDAPAIRVIKQRVLG